jgi:hypothetical protein
LLLQSVVGWIAFGSAGVCSLVGEAVAAAIGSVGWVWSSVWAQAKPMPVTRTAAVRALVAVLRVDMEDSFSGGNRHGAGRQMPAKHRLEPTLGR